jgi:hypothetical protein
MINLFKYCNTVIFGVKYGHGMEERGRGRRRLFKAMAARGKEGEREGPSWMWQRGEGGAGHETAEGGVWPATVT